MWLFVQRRWRGDALLGAMAWYSIVMEARTGRPGEEIRRRRGNERSMKWRKRGAGRGGKEAGGVEEASAGAWRSMAAKKNMVAVAFEREA